MTPLALKCQKAHRKLMTYEAGTFYSYDWAVWRDLYDEYLKLAVEYSAANDGRNWWGEE